MLESLELAQNKLTEFNVDISGLSALNALNLSNNQITELPDSLLQMQSISRIILFENDIEQFTTVSPAPAPSSAAASEQVANDTKEEEAPVSDESPMGECVDLDDAPCRARSTSVIVTSRDGDVARIQYNPTPDRISPPKYLPLPDARVCQQQPEKCLVFLTCFRFENYICLPPPSTRSSLRV